MENNLTTTNKDGLAELWKRPGGTFAKITGAGALLGAGFAFCKYALPFLVAAAGNMLLLSAELVGLAAILFAVTSKTFLRGVSLTWLQVMRKFYGCIVNIDPIAILQNGINEMKKKLDTVNDNVTKLESVLVSMKKKLNEYKETFEYNVKKRDALQKKVASFGGSTDGLKYQAQLKLVDNEITRGSGQIKSQTERIITSEKYLDIMKKLQVAADFKVKDAQNELSYMKDEYEQAKAQQKAVSSIASIIKGGLTPSLENELAMEHVTNTINTSIAEINRLIDGSNDILVNFELNSDINSAKADEIVKMFDSNGFSIFENTTDSEPKITFAGHDNDLNYFNNKADAIKLTNNEEKSPKSKYFG